MGKIIYVAHPFSNKKENRDKVEEFIHQFKRRDDKSTFISPIHTFGHDYEKYSHSEGMEHCLNLLGRCDEIYICGDWKSSKGCLMEYSFAKGADLDIKFFDDTIFDIEDVKKTIKEFCLSKDPLDIDWSYGEFKSELYDILTNLASQYPKIFNGFNLEFETISRSGITGKFIDFELVVSSRIINTMDTVSIDGLSYEQYITYKLDSIFEYMWYQKNKLFNTVDYRELPLIKLK